MFLGAAMHPRIYPGSPQPADRPDDGHPTGGVPAKLRAGEVHGDDAEEPGARV